jgi:hypothetical protein
VDVDAMADRAVTESGFFVWVANALSTHPVLAWRMHALRDRRRHGRLLWRPREWWRWRQPVDPAQHRIPAHVGFQPTPDATRTALVTGAGDGVPVQAPAFTIPVPSSSSRDAISD